MIWVRARIFSGARIWTWSLLDRVGVFFERGEAHSPADVVVRSIGMSQDDIIFDRALKECEPGVDPEFAATIDCLKAQPCFALVSSMDTSVDNRAVRTHTSRASFQENTPSMVTTWWSPQFNALLGSLVVAAGAWLAWDSFPPWGVFLVAGSIAGLLIWQGRTIGLVWAWATLLLGLESLAWPIVTMVQARSITTEPSDEQMETILSAVLTGIISAVFWVTISYGLFKRANEPIAASSTDATNSHHPPPQSKRLRRRR